MLIFHTLSAFFAGLAAAAVVVALVVLRDMPWRSAIGAFLVCSIGIFGLSVGQMMRAAAASVASMDVAVRIVQASVLLAIWAGHEVFRSAAKAPASRLHRAIGWSLIGCVLYAAVSPGGIMYRGVDGIEVAVLPWGEVVHFPRFRAEWTSVIGLSAPAVVGIRVGWFSVLQWRSGARLHAALMAMVGVTNLVTVVFFTLVVSGARPGPAFAGAGIPFLFAVAAVQAARAQRRWARDREDAIARVGESEGKLAALLGQGQTLAGILTPDGKLVMANTSALEFVGVKAEDVVGKPFPETPWWQHSSTLQRRMRQAIERAAAGEPTRFQAAVPRPDGSEAILDFSLTPYRDETGAVRWLIPEGRDVTELVRYEKRIREEQRLEVIGQLAGGVAHDFNNMLAGILGAAELARMKSNQPEVRGALDVVLNASRRAAGLTRQLLSFARRGSARSEVFSLHGLITSTLTLFARMAGPNVVTRMELGAARDRIHGDQTLLQSSLMNLLVNARDAMPDGGTITVSTQDERLGEEAAVRFIHALEEGEYVTVTVADTGCGIPPQVLPRIFEPFYTTKELGKGTGMGLAAVSGCVRDHRGAIEVETEVGRGTRFVLHLPVVRSETTPASEPSSEAAVDAGGLVALVVDDETLVRNTMAQQLQSFGFKVELSDGGEAALEVVRALPAPPAVALVDMHMPGMNGRDLTRILRDKYPNMAVILASGNFGDWDLGAIRNDALVFLMPKPAGRADLVGALMRLRVLSPRSEGR